MRIPTRTLYNSERERDVLTKGIRQTVLQRRYRSQGYYADSAYVIVWRPFFIPYYVWIWVQCKAENWDFDLLVCVTRDCLDEEPVSPVVTERVWHLISCRSTGKTRSSAK